MRCVPVLEEGVHHAAVDGAEDQPHQHGHHVLGEGIDEAVFVLALSAACWQGAVRGGGIQEHLITWKNTGCDRSPHLYSSTLKFAGCFFFFTLNRVVNTLIQRKQSKI